MFSRTELAQLTSRAAAIRLLLDMPMLLLDKGLPQLDLVIVPLRLTLLLLDMLILSLDYGLMHLVQTTPPQYVSLLLSDIATLPPG